jgi:chemotaxis protein methyltransferase CheR
MRRISDDQQAIEFVISLIYERAHIRLQPCKESLIRARLGKRQRALALPTLAAYCNYLDTGNDEQELTHAVDALTTNFTHFLREEDHFRFLAERAIPEMTAGTRQPIRIWSAACATGEEPYSIAFYLDEAFPSISGWDWRVLATDISTKALGKATQGVYAGDRIEAIPNAWLRKYFKRGFGDAEGYYQVKSQIKDRISFRQMNLLGQLSIQEKFQVIFCRNVMIYFDRETQEKLVRQLCRFLLPGGYLLTGHSESLTGLSVPLRCLRPSYYQLA